MNSYHCSGKLGRDPETKYVVVKGVSTAVTKFSVAVAHPYKPKDDSQTFWINVVAWGKMGENIQKYFSKGQGILLEGYLTEQKWTKDGQEHRMTQMTVIFWGFMGGKPEGAPAAASDDSIPF
jgi:single-strand DNA-binding protein